MHQLIWMAIAGAAGTLARFGVSATMQRFGFASPWATLAINITGCFLFGAVWMLAEERLLIGREARGIILVGFMGAFTTFSTFAFETSDMIHDGQWWLATANMAGQNALGVVCVFLGFVLGRSL